ncbi:hypothetical protein CLAFUW4_02485 [Fulvia fulva]|uniref:Uncharacterized protein n=1 Tax=Passalora fulva TaxID=5499 RepID=A0A9Q8LA43_PASFU|nr:uncharacterized protein CLAFUR5_02475 [Fulvia fulva]KAK4631544.1 hypothetical protein CLAFUR4_02480 [Fulvia fulva]KAK4633696.1 hypothetical protein CLAFUR0_02484 [Fulvia fulva]UJO13609.1 hypothetical protein CLAFUR5_02475 [Fulvia fulva]WPV11264.1 hypothetical protein CLAFUW4_02485 [Fulvia fulva]WPV26600.1 hypothetical protein CLAFUW7_02485 [Fulvia fulva]
MDAPPNCSKQHSAKRAHSNIEIDRILAANDQALQSRDSSVPDTVAPARKRTRLTKPLLLSTTGLEELADFAQELQTNRPRELELSTEPPDSALREQGCDLEIGLTEEPDRDPFFPRREPPRTVHEKLERAYFHLIKTWRTHHSIFYEYDIVCLKGVQAITIERPLDGVPPAVEMDRVVYPYRQLPSGGLYFFLPAQIKVFEAENFSR